MGKHAIIVIKNKDNEYLQYFDEIWNSYLFMNCKMKDKYDINAIKNEVYNSLEINTSDILCSFIGEKKHSKYSESAKIEKEYIHYFYKIELLHAIDILNNKEFKLSGKNTNGFPLMN